MGFWERRGGRQAQRCLTDEVELSFCHTSFFFRDLFLVKAPISYHHVTCYSKRHDPRLPRTLATSGSCPCSPPQPQTPASSASTPSPHPPPPFPATTHTTTSASSPGLTSGQHVHSATPPSSMSRSSITLHPPTFSTPSTLPHRHQSPNPHATAAPAPHRLHPPTSSTAAISTPPAPSPPTSAPPAYLASVSPRRRSLGPSQDYAQKRGCSFAANSWCLNTSRRKSGCWSIVWRC